MNILCIIKEVPKIVARLKAANNDGKITINEAIDIFVDTLISIYECESGKAAEPNLKKSAKEYIASSL
jgi:HEAT repeat protein